MTKDLHELAQEREELRITIDEMSMRKRDCEHQIVRELVENGEYHLLNVNWSKLNRQMGVERSVIDRTMKYGK